MVISTLLPESHVPIMPKCCNLGGQQSRGDQGKVTPSFHDLPWFTRIFFNCSTWETHLPRLLIEECSNLLQIMQGLNYDFFQICVPPNTKFRFQTYVPTLSWLLILSHPNEMVETPNFLQKVNMDKYLKMFSIRLISLSILDKYEHSWLLKSSLFLNEWLHDFFRRPH